MINTISFLVLFICCLALIASQFMLLRRNIRLLELCKSYQKEITLNNIEYLPPITIYNILKKAENEGWEMINISRVMMIDDYIQSYEMSTGEKIRYEDIIDDPDVHIIDYDEYLFIIEYVL